jgi:FAD/FMN-containing dehydrogenase
VEALLIIELDGPAVEVDYLIEQVSDIAKKNNCSSSRISTSEDERLLFWAGRKADFPAVGRISPDYFCMDGTIPRRASVSRKFSTAWRSFRKSMVFGWLMFSMRVMAIYIRLFFMMPT